MAPKSRRAQLIEKKSYGSAGILLKFRTEKPWTTHPGQFISIAVPADTAGVGTRESSPVKRCYSLAGAAEETRRSGIFELCVTKVPNGRGTGYLDSLRPGDSIEFFGPYGDFFWDEIALHQAQDAFHQHHLSLERLCFIGTGSGIAPLRAMILGEAGHPSGIPDVVLLQGARDLSEIPYAPEWRALLESGHFRMTACLSRAIERPPGAPLFLPAYEGRVTQFLESLAPDWGFEHTQFFICGSQQMLEQVRLHLLKIRGVLPFQIRCESFFLNQAKKAAPPAKENTPSALPPRTTSGRKAA